MAFYLTAVAGGALVDIMGRKTTGVLVLVGAAAQAATTAYYAASSKTSVLPGETAPPKPR
jgi:hypothetical protein